MSDDGFNPMDRELCPDGSCIGVIGPNGRCKECGKPGTTATQHSRNRGMVPVDYTADDDSFTDTDRTLCPDGACIGVIGPDGRCGECGRASGVESLDPRTRGLRTDEDVAEQLAVNVIKGSLAPAPEGFEDRELCPDGACVGVIGSDGRCKECGVSGDSSGG